MCCVWYTFPNFVELKVIYKEEIFILYIKGNARFGKIGWTVIL